MFNGTSDKKPWFETTNHNLRRGGWNHVAGREGEEVGYNAQTEDNCHFYQTARLNGLPRTNTVFLGGDLKVLSLSFNDFALAL